MPEFPNPPPKTPWRTTSLFALPLRDRHQVRSWFLQGNASGMFVSPISPLDCGTRGRHCHGLVFDPDPRKGGGGDGEGGQGAAKRVKPWGKSVRPVSETGKKAQAGGGASSSGCLPGRRQPLFVAEFGSGPADMRKQLDEFIVLLAQSQSGKSAQPGGRLQGSVAYFDSFCIDKSPARSAQ